MLLTQEFEPYVRHICNEMSVPQLADKVIANARPALRMHTLGMPMHGDFATVSRFGGKPALPESMAWPENRDGLQLDFILQVNLSELRHKPQAKLLPNEGMLYVFADHREQDSLYEGSFQKVIYSAKTDLKLRDIPYESDSSGINERLIRFSEIMTIYDAERLTELCAITLSDEERDVHERYFDHATCDHALHLLLGLDTHGNEEGPFDSAGGFEVPDEPLQLLFRIDWDPDDTGAQWIDDGGISAYIHPNDLAEGDFSNVYYTFITG